MRFTSVSLRSTRTWWWWGFGLLIAAPAIALALLGLRAARSERIEREQQLYEQQKQLAQLADVAISDALTELGAELEKFPAVLPVTGHQSVLSNFSVFTVDSNRVITFQRDRVIYTKQPDPLTQPAQWTLPTEEMIERARAAEAQGRTREALKHYETLARMEPRLADWARLSTSQWGPLTVPRESSLAFDPRWIDSEGVTPGGLPVALFACARAKITSDDQRTSFTLLLKRTLEKLRSGAWWLSNDTRRFYDGEIRRLIEGLDHGKTLPDDERLGEIEDIGAMVSQVGFVGNERPTHVYEKGQRAAFLILLSPSRSKPGLWSGLAIPELDLSALLDPLLKPLTDSFSFAAAIRDSSGSTLWASLPNYHLDGSHAEPVRSLAGWEIVFPEPGRIAAPYQKRLLWLGLISLLIVMLAVGLAMTVSVVKREAELARMQNEFIAGVSHEFKSPITGIRLLIERLASGGRRAPENESEYRSAIDVELNRLERHVDRLLEAQRLQEGRKEYSFAPASLVGIAEGAVNTLRSQAEAKGISLQLQASGGIPAIQLDKAAISGALENLVDNAIKYSPSGTRIDVLVRLNGDRVFANVCDQGIGIESADLSRIFDKFYRGTRGDQQSVRGSGLGLALVKAAVEAHGGTVEVASKRGEGSRFTISLPLDRHLD